MKTGILLLAIIIIGLLGCHINPDKLNYERNYLKGLKLSSHSKKPILIHFTGWGSVGYDEFNKNLIKSKEILEILNKEFITIQLYIDDETKIQEIDTINLHKIEFSNKGKEQLKKAKTIGTINAIIEMDLFERNTQPLYVITDDNRNILIKPFDYTNKDRKYFLEKLKEGLNAFKNNK